MAADKLTIYNLVLTEVGKRRLATITDDSENCRKLDALWDDTLDELQEDGPDDGWRFCKKTGVAVDREEFTISSFTDYSGTVASTTLVTTSSSHTLITGNDVSIDDTDNYNDEYEATKVSDTTFYIEVDFNSTETGTAYWTSDEYMYRYSIPSAVERLLEVKVAGVEINWVEEDGYILTSDEDETVYIDYVQAVTTTTEFPGYFTRLLVLTLLERLSYALTQSTALRNKISEDREKAYYKALALDEKKKSVDESSTAWVDAGR